MNFRFRKTFPILGKFLGFTISKKGFSINFRAGVFSKSIGTLRNVTTIDLPGTSGIFFRKERRRRRRPRPGDPYLAELERRRAWGRAAAVIIGLSAAISLARINLHPIGGCELTGHPNLTLAALVALQLGAHAAIKPTLAKRGLLLVLATCAVAWVAHVWLFGALIAPSIHC